MARTSSLLSVDAGRVRPGERRRRPESGGERLGGLAPAALAAAALIALSACTSEGSTPTSLPPETSTTTRAAVPPELSLEFVIAPDAGQMEMNLTLVGAPGERISVVGIGAERSPAMRLLDEAGSELEAGVADEVMVDFADLTHELTSRGPVTLVAEPTDGRAIRWLTLRTSSGVTPTLFGASSVEVPPGTTFRYVAAGDVVDLSTTGILDGSGYTINGVIVLELIGGEARLSKPAEALHSFRGFRWHSVRGTYEVTVTGDIGRLSLGTQDTGLRSGGDLAAACAAFDEIQQRQLATTGALREISEVIGRSITGGDLGDEWLADLKSAVGAAEPSIEELRMGFERARDTLPSFFGQDLVDIQNGVYTSWVRLRNAASVSLSPRQFFEEIALANDARLLRIGETADLAFDDLDGFTTQVCAFSIRSPEFGIET